MSARPPSVAMVSASFHPIVGGAERQALELSRALQKRGATVRVLTRRLPGLAARQEILGVPVRRLPTVGTGLVNSLSFIASLFFYLLARSYSYDVIHVHLAGSPALAAILAGKIARKPVLLKLGGGRGVGEIAVSAKTWAGRLKLKTLAWLDPEFVGVAENLREELEAFGLPSSRLTVVPNGVDPERFRPVSAEEKTRLRRTLGWPEGLVFLFTGRFSEEKRLPIFLDLWARVAEKSRNPACAVLVGSGPEEPAVREVMARHPSGLIRIEPPKESVIEAYAAADVFFLPSRSEGLSNSLLEAMASGLVVMASRVGGLPKAVEEGRSGLLFPYDDAAAWEAGIKKVLDGGAAIEALGRGAREKVLREFSIAATAETYERIYRCMLGR